MDNMNEMDDVLQELENGNNPMEVLPPSSPITVNSAPPPESAKPAFEMRSLYAAPIILFLIAIAAWTAGNNVVFSAIAAAAALVGVLLLSALGLLWHMLK